MYTLQITNTYLICTTDELDYKPMYHLIDEATKSRDSRCYFSPAYKAGIWDGYIHITTDVGGGCKCPVGLLPVVTRAIEDAEETYQILDEREDPFHLETIDSDEYYLGENIQARDYQIQAYNDIVENTICDDVSFQRGIVNIATNGGKTTIAGIFIQEMMETLVHTDTSVLFLTHSIEIARQVYDRFSSVFGEDTVSLQKQKRDTPIIIGTVLTIANMTQKRDWHEFSNRITAVIVDECHHGKANSFQQVLLSLDRAYIRVGLSGTVSKNPVDRTKIEGSIGEVTTVVTNDELISRGFSAKCACIFLPVLTDLKVPEEWNYQDVYDIGVVKLKLRAQMILTCVQRELMDNRKVLILVDRIEHGTILKSFISEKVSGHRVEFTSGQAEGDFRAQVLEDLKNGAVDVLIATTILDEGVDISGINSVIYARAGVSDRKLLQGIGRGLRLKLDGSYLHYYDFVDISHPVLLKQAKHRMTTMIKQCFPVRLIHPYHIVYSSWQVIREMPDVESVRNLKKMCLDLPKPTVTTNQKLLEKVGETLKG